VPKILPFDSLNALLQAPLPVPEETRARWLREWLEQQQARISEPDFAAAFRQVFEHYDAPPDAYLQRLIEAPEGRALAGIRFFNLNPDQPFVELLAWDGPSPEPWLPRIRSEWSVFRPFAVRALLEVAPRVEGVRVDMTLHGARCGEMHKPEAGTGMKLRPVVDASAAIALIDAVHADLRQRQPALGRQITALDAEGLDWCLEHGRALFITIEDTVAGLIACAPDRIDFLKGQVVFEEVVSPLFRGRGLASAAQCALAEQLHAENPDALLLGTIAHNNPASRRSAERAGRSALLGYYFLPFGDQD
jgi:RimJ/RimL family protein N-acetyltransferase